MKYLDAGEQTENNDFFLQICSKCQAEISGRNRTYARTKKESTAVRELRNPYRNCSKKHERK